MLRNLFILFGLSFVTLSANNGACLESRLRGDSSCGNPGGQRFFYDRVTKRCQPFYYNGCNGNENNFASAQECRDTCANVKLPEETPAMVVTVPKCKGNVRAAVNNNSQTISCDACPIGYGCKNKICCPSKDYTCNLEYDAGKFAFQGSHTPRYFYSKDADNCLLFTYYGALGNANNFETYNDCVKFCKN